MIFLLVLIALVLFLGIGFALTVELFGLILTLLVAGLIGWGADAVLPGRMPGGPLGSVLTGIAGAFVGHLVFSLLHLPHFGPTLFRIELIPAFVGSLIVVGLAQFVLGNRQPAYLGR
jgi:uncharacterized membrane protein YeaQ/YmgE (transglycosylase-associated protein family)